MAAQFAKTSSTGEKGTGIDGLDINAWLTQNRLTKLKQYFEDNEVILSDLLKYQEGDMNVVLNDVNITAGAYVKRFKDSVRELQHIHNKTILSPPSQSNLNKVYRIVTSMKEDQCMLLLERKLNEIDVALKNNINITSKLRENTKKIENDINLAFNLYKNKLTERQKLMVNKLNEEANKQLNTLQTQKRNFSKYKVSIETAQKAQNSLVLDPQFDRAKRQSKIEEMTNNVTNSINENEMKTEIHPLTFTADNNAMIQCIASIGAINMEPDISTIATPMLLTLSNNKQSGAVMIKWDILRRNKNKNEKIKIEWILQHDIDEKKEEKVDLDEKVMALDENIKNETTITVKQVGIYEFQLSYNNGVQRQYSPKSNIKSISIVNVWKKIGTDLIIKGNETKILESDIIHKFDTIIIESNGTLTTKEWNGNCGGNLVLQTYAIIIKSNAKIEVDGKGYKGGKAKKREKRNGTAFQGESVNSKGSMSTSANKGGGGGGIGSIVYGSVGGGGGGYGTVGSAAEPNRFQNGNNPGGKGGDIYGDAELSELLLGSGGGSGHPYSGGDGKVGGNGGGIIFITTTKLLIENNGSITSNGQNAPSVNNGEYVSGGGGGSGGSIYIKCKELINNGNISVIGGKGAPKGNEGRETGICSDGGDGGYGRIRIDTGNAVLNKVGNVVPNVGYTANY